MLQVHSASQRVSSIEEASYIQDVYPSNGRGIINRDEAREFLYHLNPNDPLFLKISRILATYETGIFQINSGLKINATKYGVLGGEEKKFEGAIKLQISSEKHPLFTSKRKTTVREYHLDPQSLKYITKYDVRLKGDKNDIACIDYSVSYRSSNATASKKDISSKETGVNLGEYDANANVPTIGGGGLKANPHATASSKSEKLHEENYSNQAVVLTVMPKNELFKPKGPVEIFVDVWTEDLPNTEESKGLIIRAVVEDVISEKGSIHAIAGGGVAGEETLNRIQGLYAQVFKAKAPGDISARATIPLKATDKQMGSMAEIAMLKESIKIIAEELNTLEGKKKEAMQEYKLNKGDTFLADVCKEDIESYRLRSTFLTKAQQMLEERIVKISLQT